jgi:transposase-like protein
MAQYQITPSDDVLKGLFASDHGIAGLSEQVLNQILQAQATEQLQAEPYERSADRQGYRNGTRPHPLTTRVGPRVLRVPRLRNGTFSTELFARYQRREQALLLALMEMVINGVSTRKIAAITEELCGETLSKSTVSALCQRLDPVVRNWNDRSLQARRYPFVLVDALVVKIREEGAVRPRAALIAVGVNEGGYREVLGIRLDDSESEASWAAFFGWLKDRGLHGVDCGVSDDHRGLVKAVHAQFQGAAWPRCQPHCLRNLRDATPKAWQDAVTEQVRAILDAPDLETARLLRDHGMAAYGAKAPKALKRLDEAFDDITAVLVLPERYRQRLRTTNGVERLNGEIRRRDRMIRIDPRRDSALGLIGALLMEIDEKWQTGPKYFDMADYEAWRQAQTAQPAALPLGQVS